VHEAFTKQLLAVRFTVDLKAINGYTALQAAERQHAGTARLIRNKKQETPLLGSRDESRDGELDDTSSSFDDQALQSPTHHGV
jgi:hypothetical protein